MTFFIVSSGRSMFHIRQPVHGVLAGLPRRRDIRRILQLEEQSLGKPGAPTVGRIDGKGGMAPA